MGNPDLTWRHMDWIIDSAAEKGEEENCLARPGS